MVFQSYALFPHLTVEQNVAFGLQMRKVGRAEAARRVEESLELVGLGHLGNRRPGLVRVATRAWESAVLT